MNAHYGKKLLVLFLVTSTVYLQKFLLIPVLSRNLGMEIYGIWSQITVAVAFLVPFCLLALPEAFVRFSAGKTDKIEISRNYYTVLFSIITAGFFVSILFFASAGSISATFIKTDKEILPLVRAAALLLFFQCLSQFSTDYFRTFQKEKIYSLLQLFLAIGTIVLALAAIAAGYGLYQIIISVIFIHVIIFVFSQIIISRDIGWHRPDSRSLKSFLLFSLPLFPVSVFQWIVNTSDHYIIGFFLPVTEVAKYSACYTLSLVIMFFYAPFYVILMPKLTESWELKDENNLRKVLHYSNKLPLLISIPIVFGYAVLYEQILKVIVGESVQVSVLLIPAICIGYILFFIGGYYALVFSLVRKTKYTTLGYIVGAITNIVGNVILVPLMGIFGAAIMTLATFLIQTLYLARKSKEFYDLGLNWDFLWKSVAAAIGMFLLLMFLKPYLLSFGDLSFIFISAAVGGGAYFVLLFMMGVFKKEEIELVRDLLAGK
jgi:O-antigen/teichoic acid export membrane protein